MANSPAPNPALETAVQALLGQPPTLLEGTRAMGKTAPLLASHPDARVLTPDSLASFLEADTGNATTSEAIPPSAGLPPKATALFAALQDPGYEINPAPLLPSVVKSKD